MRIEQLQYVAAVTQYGSLRRASEHLHVSQPALSESLTKLEKELGVTLLDRRRSGTRISDTGRELLQHIVEVLDAAERLRAAAGDQLRSRAGDADRHGQRRHVHPAAAGDPGVPAAVPGRRASRSATCSRTRSTGTSSRARSTSGWSTCSAATTCSPELAGIDLLQGSPVAVLSGEHPLVEKSEVTVDDLRAEQFVAMRSGYLMYRFAHRLFGARPARRLAQHRRCRDGQGDGRRRARASRCSPTTASSATRSNEPD